MLVAGFEWLDCGDEESPHDALFRAAD